MSEEIKFNSESKLFIIAPTYHDFTEFLREHKVPHLAQYTSKVLSPKIIYADRRDKILGYRRIIHFYYVYNPGDKLFKLSEKEFDRMSSVLETIKMREYRQVGSEDIPKLLLLMDMFD